MRNLKGILLIALLLGVIFSSGCVRINLDEDYNVETLAYDVEREDAESVRVDIDMGFGELRVDGGAAKLMEGEFYYSQDSWKPEVYYRTNEDEGRLTVEQPSSIGNINIGKNRYEWDLSFNNDIAMDLRVKMGAGTSVLNLGDLQLRNLEVSTGAGTTDVDLTGDWDHDLDAYIKGGVGTATIIVPKDVGVIINAKGGIGAISARGFDKEDGAYVNEAYGKTDTTLRIEVEGGVGEIDLKLAD